MTQNRVEAPQDKKLGNQSPISSASEVPSPGLERPGHEADEKSNGLYDFTNPFVYMAFSNIHLTFVFS